MNRRDVLAEVVRLEQLSFAAKDRAADLRKQLSADAQAEWHEQGSAPTWRMDVGTVSLPISHDSIVVRDPAALVGWCAEHHPSEVETVRRVRESYVGWLREHGEMGADEDGTPVVVDPSTREVVAGLSWEPGGQPGALSIRPDAGTKREYRQLAEAALDSLTVESPAPASHSHGEAR